MSLSGGCSDQWTAVKDFCFWNYYIDTCYYLADELSPVEENSKFAMFQTPTTVSEDCQVELYEQSEACKTAWNTALQQCLDYQTFVWTETCDTFWLWHEDWYIDSNS